MRRILEDSSHVRVLGKVDGAVRPEGPSGARACANETMGLALRQIKTYAKLVAMVAAAVAVLLVVLMNRNHKVDVWLFHSFPQTNVLWVMLVSGISAVVIAWTLARVRRVIRDVREIRKAKVVEAQMAEQRRLAAELKEQEDRIDTKIQSSIGQADSSEET